MKAIGCHRAVLAVFGWKPESPGENHPHCCEKVIGHNNTVTGKHTHNQLKAKHHSGWCQVSKSTSLEHNVTVSKSMSLEHDVTACKKSLSFQGVVAQRSQFAGVEFHLRRLGGVWPSTTTWAGPPSLEDVSQLAQWGLVLHRLRHPLCRPW